MSASPHREALPHREAATFEFLPHDIILMVLGHCDMPALTAVCCCSTILRTQASDASLWCSLLRERHMSLLGIDMDPHCSLLPSVALLSTPRVSGSPRPEAAGQGWQQLYFSCIREWSDSTDPRKPLPQTQRFLLAWQRRMAERDEARLITIGVILRLALTPLLSGSARVAMAVSVSGTLTLTVAFLFLGAASKCCSVL
jgi:hypothetical protein